MDKDGMNEAITHLKKAADCLTNFTEGDNIPYRNTILNIECRLRSASLSLESIVNEINRKM